LAQSLLSFFWSRCQNMTLLFYLVQLICFAPCIMRFLAILWKTVKVSENPKT
jgi:hypothetical protein